MPVETTTKPTNQQVFMAVPGAEPLEDAYLWPIDRIVGYEDQPREYFDEDEINSIAASMKRKHKAGKGVGKSGFIQPILARWAPGAVTESGNIKKNAKIMIVAGEKRFHSAKRAGLDKVPVNVVDEDDDEAYEDALLENILRGDMTPTELGNGFLAIMNMKGWKGHGRYTRLARHLYGDTSRADYIRGMVNSLGLGDDAETLVSNKKQSKVAARRIATVKDADKRRELIQFMAEGGTVRELEKKIRAYRTEHGYAAGQQRGSSNGAQPVGQGNLSSNGSTKLGTPKAPGTVTLPRVSLELALDSIMRHTDDTYQAMQPPVTLTKKQKKELLERAQQAHANLSSMIEFLSK